MPASSCSVPKRFHSLDVLRGIASLVVVINHWPNFFYYQGGITKGQLPLPVLFRPFYADGWRAVDLFFCLSGFIFFWLYVGKISQRKIGAGEFSILRFSRLYPLHFATLILVAGAQWVMRLTFGADFTDSENDVFHFILHLFLAGAWGGLYFGKPSFNDPVWSVSIEILLYALFFVLCRRHCVHWLLILGYVCVSEYAFIHHDAFLGSFRGTLGFFLGGLAFYAYEVIVRRTVRWRWLPGLIVLTAVLWVLVPLEVNHQYTCQLYHSLLGGFHQAVFLVIGHCLPRISGGLYELLLFPLTLLTLALWETRRGTLGRRLGGLGDISYSTYLLHFPLQIAFLWVANAAGISLSFFRSPLSLLLFFLVLIPASLACYHWFERPAQTFLRQKLLPEKTSPKPICE